MFLRGKCKPRLSQRGTSTAGTAEGPEPAPAAAEAAAKEEEEAEAKAEAKADTSTMGQELGKHRRTHSDAVQRETEKDQETCPDTASQSPGDVFLSETANFTNASGPPAGRKVGHSSPEDSLSPERPAPENGQRRSSLQRWMWAANRVREGSIQREVVGPETRKMSLETWDKWDPELTVKMIRVPSVQNYGKIRRVLQLADR